MPGLRVPGLLAAIFLLVGCAQTLPAGFDPAKKIDDPVKYIEDGKQQLTIDLVLGDVTRAQANRRLLRLLTEVFHARPEYFTDRGLRTQAVSLHIDWQDVGRLDAKLYVAVDPKIGEMSVDLPKEGGACKGLWSVGAGSYPKNAAVSGDWVMFCPSGLAGEGSFHSPLPHVGTGQGLDSKGRKIAFSYAP